MSIIVTRETVVFNFSMKLAGGRILPEFKIAYETYGKLNRDGDNVILICHGLTSDQHVITEETDSGTNTGWWQSMVGPSLAIDTDKYFVVSTNALGGFSGSTSPASLNPETGQPYGTNFPIITIADMVDAQRHLAEHLGIPFFHTVIGGCMGGFMVLEWLCRYPQSVNRAVLISTSPKVSVYTQAMWAVMRKAIQLDPSWNKGQYYGGDVPRAGLGLMAQIGALFWMGHETMEKKFNSLPIQDGQAHYSLGPDFEIETFLDGVGDRASDRIDANSLLYLMRAMDYFDLARDYGSLENALGGTRGEALLVSYGSDWRYPPSQLDLVRLALEKIGAKVEHQILDSDFGHGAFVYDTNTLAPILTNFLG